MGLRFFLFFGVLISFLANLAFAGSANGDGYSAEEKLIRQKVRTRAYPGGRDEEPLRVQTQLSTANRKVVPTLESTESNESSSSDSTDSND